MPQTLRAALENRKRSSTHGKCLESFPATPDDEFCREFA
jgi:hypothetical protein